jgi:hypothetical protein
VVGQKHPRRDKKVMRLPARWDHTNTTKQRELGFAKMSSTWQQLAGHKEEAVRKRQASQGDIGANHKRELRRKAAEFKRQNFALPGFNYDTSNEMLMIKDACGMTYLTNRHD